jgi:hypothetical protein
MSTLKKCTGVEVRSPVQGMVSNKDDVMLFFIFYEELKIDNKEHLT